MNYLLDTLIGFVAPHQCMSCGKEGSVLCTSCIEDYFEYSPPQCAGCHALSDNFTVCRSCKKWLPLDKVFFASPYSSTSKQLIAQYKFHYRRQAADSIARIVVSLLKDLPPDTVLCPIPSARSRIRSRGFDHSVLLAREVAKSMNIKVECLLARRSNARQVGSSRSDRFRQISDEFIVTQNGHDKNKNVLLIDDVMTSGATLSEAATVLKKAGAKRVSAVVLARK